MKYYDHKIMVKSRVIFSMFLGWCVLCMLVGFLALIAAQSILWAWDVVIVAAVGLVGAFAAAVRFWPKDFDMGLGFTGPIETAWRRSCIALGFSWQDEKQNVLVPALRRLHGRSGYWRATITPVGDLVTLDKLSKHADDFAVMLGVASVSFLWTVNAEISIVAASVNIPVVEVPAVVVPHVVSPVELLSAVPVAVDMDGQPFKLSVIDNHILLCGESGGGKSSWIWSLVVGLAPAVRAGVVKLWGVDPKQLELAIAPAWWDRYACNQGEMTNLIAEFEQEMRARNGSLAGKMRKFRPSEEFPLNVLIVDELADLITGVEKKESEKVNRLLTNILRQGRAAGYVVIGATQSPLKEAVPCRDDFITKVGLRMRSSLVDILMGTGAKEAGCRCWEIPYKTGAGTAFVIGESGQVARVRARWFDDDIIQRLGQLVRLGDSPWDESVVSVTEVEQVAALLSAPGNV